MSGLFGNTQGLSPNAVRSLERLYRRTVPLDSITTPELLKNLAEASRECKRQVGVLVHRSGVVENVIVGTPTGLMLPDIGRLRGAEGRFRALRLIHTHLFNEPLTRDDLTDLTRLRLDMVAALQLSHEYEPRQLTWAHNVPSSAQPYEIHPPQPWSHPQPNFGALIHALEEEFARIRGGVEVKRERAILVHVSSKKNSTPKLARAAMAELRSLAETAGTLVVEQVIQLRDKLDPKFLLGKGKLEEILIQAIDVDADVLIFDGDLSPSQAGEIAARTDLMVIDRTQLILDIFAQRAETKDGRLQVELAQLKHRLPRLSAHDDSLGRLGAGIGGRGPGETKLEIGKRRTRDRITKLSRDLKALSVGRTERRRKRAQSILPVVAIVGYTNAGKSTTLNTMTGAGVLAEDKLFATLDTRARRLFLPSGRNAVLTDTVGFIRKMPKDLFAAFKATFEETADADLLLEIIDASDPSHPRHCATTQGILTKLKLDGIPRLKIYNKVDLLSPAEKEVLELDPENSLISAVSGDLTELLEKIDAALPQDLGRSVYGKVDQQALEAEFERQVQEAKIARELDDAMLEAALLEEANLANIDGDDDDDDDFSDEDETEDELSDDNESL